MNIRNHYSIQFLYYNLVIIDIFSKIIALVFWTTPNFGRKRMQKYCFFLN